MDWRAGVKRGFLFSEVTLGYMWITSLTKGEMPHQTAVELVTELFHKTGAQRLFDEKEARDQLVAIHKGPLQLAQFKKFLVTTMHDAVLAGALEFEPGLIVGTQLEEDLQTWVELPPRYYEFQGASAPEGGEKKGHRRRPSIMNSGAKDAKTATKIPKKGSLLRALRRRVIGVGKTELLVEDSKGRVNRFSSELLNEVEYGSIAAKVIQKFVHLDEQRGVAHVNMETDPMGLGLPTAVLGVDVATCVKRSPDRRSNVPTFLLQAVDYIDKNIIEEGLYRIPGGAKRINELCFVANRGHLLTLDLGDVEACCSVVVRWLRTLPEGQGLLWNTATSHLRPALSAAAGNVEERKRVMRQVIDALPPENSATLLFLTGHFKRVSEAANKMTLANLDICIPGNLDVQTMVTYGPSLWNNWADAVVPRSPRVDHVRALQGHRTHVRSPTITVAPTSKSPPPEATAPSAEDVLQQSDGGGGGNDDGNARRPSISVVPAHAHEEVLLVTSGASLVMSPVGGGGGSQKSTPTISPRPHNIKGATASGGSIPTVKSPHKAPSTSMNSSLSGVPVPPARTSHSKSPSGSPRASPRVSPRVSPRQSQAPLERSSDVSSAPPLPVLPPPLPSLPPETEPKK